MLADPWIKHAPAYEKRIIGSRLTKAADSAPPMDSCEPARPALHALRTTPGAGATTEAPCAVPTRAGTFSASDHPTKSPNFTVNQLEVLSVLGPPPFNRRQVLEALQAGHSLRIVERALLTLMTRREARELIATARIVLGRKGNTQ